MRKNKIIITIALILAALALAALIFLRSGAISAPAPTESPAPTPTATPEPTQTPAPVYFTISMVGDCTLASSQYFYHYEPTLDGDLAWPFSGTKQFFEDDYLSIANLECSLSDRELGAVSTFHFLGAAEHAQVLVEGGIDFVTLSNNHTMDFGEDGLSDTKEALDAAGVSWAAPDGSFIYCRDDGLRIGLYAARWMAGQEEIVAGVSALAQEELDLVICLMHWGLEGSYRVTAGQEQLGRAVIDAGADVVYGSHPHVLQRIDEYGGGYIINSLGNYSFGGNTNPRDKDTAIVQLLVMRDSDGSVSLQGYTAIPCSLSSSVGVNDYRPVPYEEGSAEYERAMSKLDGSFNGPDLTIDYSAYHQNDDEGETAPAEESAEESAEENAAESAPAEGPAESAEIIE